jgi:hypothetical protein
LIPAFGHAVEHFVSGVAVCAGPCAAGLLQDFCLGNMDATARKLVMIADMIKVGMTCHAGHLALADQRNMGPQAKMTEARIEQQVAIAPAHMPHVAAIEGLDPWFMNERHVIAHAYGLVPLSGLHPSKHRSVPQRYHLGLVKTQRYL